MTSPADYTAALEADLRRPHKPLREWLEEQERRLDQGQRLARPSEMRAIRWWEQQAQEEWEP